MDCKQLIKVMKKTRALVDGTEEMGLLVTGQDPLILSDMDLVSFIQNAGIADIDDIFDTMDLEITHGSLAAMAFAVAPSTDGQPHAIPRQPLLNPLAGPSYIGQSQPPYLAPGAPNPQIMMDPQMMQSIVESVKASLVNDGWKAPQPAADASRLARSSGVTSLQEDAKDAAEMDIEGEAASMDIGASRCQVFDTSELPTSVRIPHGIIERIFAGSPAEVAGIINASTIMDKQDVSRASGADIEYTLRYIKVDRFSISNTSLKIEAVKASDSYTLTIPRIDFKVKGEFKYKMKLFGFGPKGTGSYDVVGSNWSVMMEFKFEAERDGGIILNMLKSKCTEHDVELVNLQCSVPELMKVFENTPKNYVAKEMKRMLVETFELVIHKSAKEVLKTVTYKGTRDELQLHKMYPGMEEGCILHVCHETLRNPELSDKLMTIDINVANLLPDDVITRYRREEISKTERHNPTIQAKRSLVDALQDSIDPTKVVKLLKVLDREQPVLARKIEEVHKKEMTKHRGSCDKCSQK